MPPQQQSKVLKLCETLLDKVNTITSTDQCHCLAFYLEGTNARFVSQAGLLEVPTERKNEIRSLINNTLSTAGVSAEVLWIVRSKFPSEGGHAIPNLTEKNKSWKQRLPKIIQVCNELKDKFPQQQFFVYLARSEKEAGLRKYEFSSAGLQALSSSSEWGSLLAAEVLHHRLLGNPVEHACMVVWCRVSQTSCQQTGASAALQRCSKRRRGAAGTVQGLNPIGVVTSFVQDPNLGTTTASEVAAAGSLVDGDDAPDEASFWEDYAPLPSSRHVPAVVGDVLAKIGTDAWYQNYLYCKGFCVRLASHLWAAPDYKPMRASSPESLVPIQVRCMDGHYSCSCPVYAQGSFEGEHLCLHTRFAKSHATELEQLPIPLEGSVVPIMPIGCSNPKEAPYFWIKDAFVSQSVSGDLRCGHVTCRATSCPGLSAVCQFLGRPRMDITVADLEDIPTTADVEEEQEYEVDDLFNDDVDNVTAAKQYTYPACQPCMQHMLDLEHAEVGPPPQLKPEIPDRVCFCENPHFYTEVGYTLVKSSCRVHCYGRHGTALRALYDLRCPSNNPECTLRYDGYRDGLFMHSNETAIALRFLYESVDEFTQSGTAPETYAKNVMQRRKYLIDVNDEARRFCGANTFRAAFYSFISRLDRQYTFRCQHCGDTPEILIADATSVSIRKEAYHGTPITTYCDCTGQSEYTAPPRPHKRSDRCLADSKEKRADMAAFAAMIGAGVQSTTATTTLDTFAQGRLIRAFASIAPFLQELYGLHVQGALDDSSRRAIARLLRTLASDSPVSSYFPTSVAAMVAESMLMDECVDLSEQHADLLRYEAPVIFAAISSIATATTGWCLCSQDSISLLRELHRLSCVCSSGQGAGDICEGLERVPSSNSACLGSGVCCGLLRVRPRYPCALDGVHSTTEQDDHGWGDCRHEFKAGSHGSHRTGGLFSWYCQHGICYGFYMMPNAEGRNEAYSFLTGYFRVAPKVVVYDFACALQDYCLNRAPAFFKHTRFVVDRFHWRNHSACGSGYNLSLYPDPQLLALNSQVAEQMHSVMQRVKASVRQMGQFGFMLCMRLFMDVWNERKAAQLAEINSYIRNILLDNSDGDA